MTFRRYSTCRASRVEWLGEVPQHWPVCGLGHRYEVALVKMLDEKKISGQHLGPYLRNVDVQWDCINIEDLPEMDFSGDDLNRYSLIAGDLLVCEGGDVGRAAIWRGELKTCFYQKALHRLRARTAQDHPRYLLYALRAASNAGAFSAGAGKATIIHLPAETFRRHRFPFPPLAEQLQIVAFLDRETAKIDALVEEQRRLIELLKEKRQAAISHAVTRGLDPSAPVKDSGVEWLGEVPSHWQLVALARLVTPERPITYGIVQPGALDPNGRFMVRGQDYSFGWVDPGDIFRVSQEVEEPYRRARLKGGDLVVTIVGAGTGNVAVVPDFLDGANITQTTARVAPLVMRIDPRYLRLALTSWLGRVQVALYQKGAAQPGLNLEHLKAFRITLPPLQEQTAIADAITPQTRRMEGLISEAQAAIDLLYERRAALISAAVTGKIDVREPAATPTELEPA